MRMSTNQNTGPEGGSFIWDNRGRTSEKGEQIADTFLGQYLSNRTRTAPIDPTREKVWLALRYLIMIGFLVTFLILVDTDPSAAFLIALGGALLASALVNVALLPTGERRDGLNAIWAALGLAGLVGGIAILG